MFLYTVLVLPEALTPERKEMLMDANEATQESDSAEISGNEVSEEAEQSEGNQGTARWATIMRRINFFKKLAILLPKVNESGKGRDYRLFILAIAFSIYRIGGLYTNDVRQIHPF